MKKSNKLTFFYVLSAVGLFLVLLGGGVYGVYVSVGLNFARSSVPNIAENGAVSNVSMTGTVNYTPSMTGIIFLSIILVVISVFDFISLIKQIVFFKQYKIVKNSSLEKKIEQKTKSKSSVIFWTFLIDIISFVAGIAGLFINGRSFAGKSNFSWVFYAVDIAVSVLALLSMILLIAKLKNRSTEKNSIKPKQKNGSSQNGTDVETKMNRSVQPKDLSQIEYSLIKLDAMKKSKLVNDDEYKKIRKKIINFTPEKNYLENNKKDYWFFNRFKL